MKLVSALVSLVAIGCSASAPESPECEGGKCDGHGPAECRKYGYEEGDGPALWGSFCEAYEKCDSGTEQSPIDLAGATKKAGAVALALASKAVTASVVNNGETIKATVPPGTNSMTLDGTKYELLQFHFHIPSEHTIDGKSFPMELHLVHKSEAGGLAVLGLMIEEGADNEVLAPLFDKPLAPATSGADRVIDLPALAPNIAAGVYRYAGSLTTPPCGEGVKWNVVATPISASSEQIANYDELYEFSTNRPVQPLKGRQITLVTAASGL